MMKLRMHVRKWTLDPPFLIANQTFNSIDALIVELVTDDGLVGRGETIGVDYRGETAETMQAELEVVRSSIESEITRCDLPDILPPGGARNGVDLALWDIESKQKGQPVYQLAGLPTPRPIPTAFTIGLMSTADAARKAQAAKDYALIKVKVDAVRNIEVLQAIRTVRPDATLIVDANQSWDLNLLQTLTPELERIGIAVLEQPLAAGTDVALGTYSGRVQLMADESCQYRGDLPSLIGRYSAINIKLDKTGGLTEALALAREAKKCGLKLMVGNMCGSSLAMAPAFLLAQICDFADLDGPLLQTSDWPHSLHYSDGLVHPPAHSQLWGGL